MAKDLAVTVFKMTNENVELKRHFRFKAQLTSSAVSIASNIAEGDEMKSVKHSIHYFYIAKGSCAELKTQLIIANEVGLLKSQKSWELIKNVIGFPRLCLN